MSIKHLTLQDRVEWNQILSKLSKYKKDVYFTPEYYSLYQEYGDGKACCFVFEKEGEIAL